MIHALNFEHNCQCEACRDGMEAVMKKQKEQTDKHGWIIHYIPKSKEHPFGVNIHTHGLADNFNHPDLQIVIPMRPEFVHKILITAVEKHIKKNEPYVSGKKYTDLVTDSEGTDYGVLFIDAVEDGRKVLRMIFPEKDGSFIGEFVEKQKKDLVQ